MGCGVRPTPPGFGIKIHGCCGWGGGGLCSHTYIVTIFVLGVNIIYCKLNLCIVHQSGPSIIQIMSLLNPLNEINLKHTGILSFFICLFSCYSETAESIGLKLLEFTLVILTFELGNKY